MFRYPAGDSALPARRHCSGFLPNVSNSTAVTIISGCNPGTFGETANPEGLL